MDVLCEKFRVLSADIAIELMKASDATELDDVVAKMTVAMAKFNDRLTPLLDTYQNLL